MATIKTELDFLLESGVITSQQSKQILGQLPSHPSNSVGVTKSAGSLGEYVLSLYAFQGQQEGDLSFKAGEKIEVLEKPSPEWYKGRCNGVIGMFPSNYVKPLFGDSNSFNDTVAPPQYQVQHVDPNYNRSSFPPVSTSYQQQPPQGQYFGPAQQQPSLVPYQQPQVQYGQQPVLSGPVQGGGSGVFNKIGGKLGNAALFGAGATLGSEIVHGIFD